MNLPVTKSSSRPNALMTPEEVEQMLRRMTEGSAGTKTETPLAPVQRHRTAEQGRVTVVRQALLELIGRLPMPARLLAKRNLPTLVAEVDRVAQARISDLRLSPAELTPEVLRKQVAEPAVDAVMQTYASQMTAKQWATAFLCLAGLIGIGSFYLPLQQPITAVLGPILGAAWWKWNMISGSWSKKEFNPPQRILYREQEIGDVAHLTAFLEEMMTLPNAQATNVADRVRDGINILKDAQLVIHGQMALLPGDRGLAADSLTAIIKTYGKQFWYVRFPEDTLVVLRNFLRDRGLSDHSFREAVAERLREQIPNEAGLRPTDARTKVRESIAFLDQLLGPAAPATPNSRAPAFDFDPRRGTNLTFPKMVQYTCGRVEPLKTGPEAERSEQ